MKNIVDIIQSALDRTGLKALFSDLLQSILDISGFGYNGQPCCMCCCCHDGCC